MAKINIHYVGGIDSKEQWKNLTWSQTILWVDFWKTKTPTIVVDAGAIQWVKKANELNKIIHPWVLNSDFLVITHAHADHAWLVPYLVKKWFSGKIIMTKLTKLQSEVMWLDYVNLTKLEIEKMKEWNAKLAKKLHDALQIVYHYEELERADKTSAKLKTSEKYLQKVVENKTHLEAYKESISVLSEYGVESEKDISSVLQEIPFLLFDEDDIEKTLSKIEVLETGENIELQNFHPISSWKDPIIDKLPIMVKEGHKKPIPVLTVFKGTVISKLTRLWENVTRLQEENQRIQKENTKKSEEIQFALNFIEFTKEQTENLERFEKRYGHLVSLDEGNIESSIQEKEVVSLHGKTWNIYKLLSIYENFSFPLPKDEKAYFTLSNELHKLWIYKLDDINKHLPELPERDYEGSDVRKGLKASFSSFDWELKKENYISFIDDIEKFSIEEILDMLYSEKRIYIKKSLFSQLKEKVAEKLQINDENHRKNLEIQETLQQAYDLVQMYEGDNKLYIKNNAWKYKKVKKITERFKRETFGDIYEIDELEDIIDIEWSSISKETTVVHIKKLDDKRMYDILFSKNKDITYYIEPKIRERMKEKLIDYINEFRAKKMNYEKSLQEYNEYVHFIKIYEWKESHNFSKAEYESAKKLLENHGISHSEDIEGFYIFETFTQYSSKNIDALFHKMIVVADNFQENDIIFTHITHEDDERIFNIPYDYEDQKNIFVIKNGVKEGVRKKLMLAIWDYFKTLSVRKAKKANLREKVELLQNYVDHFEYLFGIEWYNAVSDFIQYLQERKSEISSLQKQLKDIKLAKKLQEKLTQWTSNREEEYQKAKALLEKYAITSAYDISNALEVLHEISYSNEDVKKAISLLKWVHIDKNSDILESLKLNFVDAGHLEGSIQVVVTAVVSTIEHILQPTTSKKSPPTRQLKHTNFALSGDLWRMKDPNLSGSPEKIPYALDYYQVESTYAWREHMNKALSTKKIFESIATSKWKILIPAFSMQRTQEILMLLLEKRIEWKVFIDQMRHLSQEKKKIIQTIEKTSHISLRTQLEQDVANLDLQIQYLSGKVCDYDIILDSPTSEAITKIYIEHCGERYDLLNPKTQIKLFGKEVITYVKSSSWSDEADENKVAFEDIYSESRRNKKEIIISASGMADWGSILPHLKENLQNPNSKIIFVWYCPLSTRWWKIKAGDEFISIDGEAFKVECEYDDITGFSWHIDEQEILSYLSELKFKKWAIIALTHGDEKRLLLAEKIEQTMKEVWQKVKVIVPQLWSTTSITL